MLDPRIVWLEKAVVWLFGGTYALYVVGRHRGYVRQLQDSLGNRKIKQRAKIYFVMGILMLLASAWNFWRFFTSK